MSKETFDIFANGCLSLPIGCKNFSQLCWCQHPNFSGVNLKHLITAEDTENAYSFHLVSIEPYMKIGEHFHNGQLETHEVIAGHGFCINNGVEIKYKSGVLSIFAANTLHQVVAGKKGLYIFAKFFPALC